MKATTFGPQGIERPEPNDTSDVIFGSDAIAQTIRDLNIPYIALNPGASFRGLHDSLVNHLGNKAPQILLCLHEESAVAIAHGYAKVTGKPMLAAVHSNVGLMHATMAIFNAWCDRAPVIVIGAGGPGDAVQRRPFIDWLHTARDQGAMVRHYTKWDDRPQSAAASRDSLLRAYWLSTTAPMGPVYIELDVVAQEERLAAPLPDLPAARYLPTSKTGVNLAAVAQLADQLALAQKPVILMGRMSGELADWQARIELAERLGAQVISHRKLRATFPTDHPLHAGPPVLFVEPIAKAALQGADLVLSLDWVDLAGTLLDACGTVTPDKTLIHVSLDHQIHNGWSMDHQAHPAADLHLSADPDQVVHALLAALPQGGKPLPKVEACAPQVSETRAGEMRMLDMARTVRAATSAQDVTLLHLPTSWNSADWHFTHPMDFIGSEGGGGIGGGPGVAVGAALALIGSGRLPLAFLGDGDYLMGVTALWTACHYRIPLLAVIANNQSFYNDEVHQERVARMRGRPVANKWIGQRMIDPEIDLAAMATAQGALGLGPARTAEQLAQMMVQAIAHVEAGGVAVIDARVSPGYSKATRDAMAGTATGR